MTKANPSAPDPFTMKSSSLFRLTFAGILLAGLSTSIPALRADDDGGGCSSCCDATKAKSSPTPAPSPSATPESTSTNATAK